ncbi:hypothetical protein GUT189_06780 [Streptococcus ruminantium]|nr:hypothetical protein GUT189_06780 [Streptococcus ruminantium]
MVAFQELVEILFHLQASQVQEIKTVKILISVVDVQIGLRDVLLKIIIYLVQTGVQEEEAMMVAAAVPFQAMEVTQNIPQY